MINDIREYYCNLTKLQRKKFEVMFYDLYYRFYNNEIDSLIIISYLRIYHKIQSGRKYNAITLLELESKIENKLLMSTKLLVNNYNEFNMILNPDFNIDYKNTEIYLLDLFQRVLK